MRDTAVTARGCTSFGVDVGREPASISLADTVRFLITTLIRWAQTRQYGEIRIVVQAGQIEFIHEDMSYRGTVPKRSGPGMDAAERAAGHLTAQ